MKLPPELELKKSHTAAICHVDDDELFINLVKRYHKKSNITNPYLSFTHGDQLIQHLKKVSKENKELPLIILLDINMPGKDGFEVLSEIKSYPEFKTIPLCSMLSSSNYQADINKSKDLGATSYLVKPDNARNYIDFFHNISHATSVAAE